MSRDGQYPEILVSESPTLASVPGESRHNPTETTLQRKVFYLVDSLNVGGTEVQAVELAIRLNPERYNVTLGCLRARGPLLERLQGSGGLITLDSPEAYERELRRLFPDAFARIGELKRVE